MYVHIIVQMLSIRKQHFLFENCSTLKVIPKPPSGKIPNVLSKPWNICILQCHSSASRKLLYRYMKLFCSCLRHNTPYLRGCHGVPCKEKRNHGAL